MDEEQPKKKITLSNFFESIQSVDKTANRALKKTDFNLGIINSNKSLIETLSKSFDIIKTEIKEIKEYITIEKDLEKDKLFSQEDQEQKIRRLERLQGIEGSKVDPADAAAGTTDDSDFQKQASDTVKKALQNPDVVSILTGLIGLSVAGLMGAGEEAVEDVEEAVEDVKERKFSEKTGGVLDSLSGNLTDFDRRGGKPVGVSGAATGIIDFFTANMFDLDKRGGLFESKESFERREKINEKIKEEKKNRPKKGLMRFLPFKFGTEIGGVDGPDGIDRIPAMLTKGETVLSKDESENLKEMGVFNVDKLVGGLKKMFSEGKETTRSLQNLSDEDYYYLGLAVSGEATLNSDDVYGVVASILNRVASKQYKNTVKDVVLSSDTADGKMEYEALNIMDVNNPNISKEVKNFLQGDKRNIIKDLKSEKGQKEIIEAIQILDGRTNYKGQDQISNRVKEEDPMFDPKGNFFHYNFQETPMTLRNATEEQKNYRPPTIKDFVKQIEPKPTGLMRVVSGVLDAVTGDKYDFDGRSSDNLQSVIESKSDQLAQNILTPPTTQSNNVNLLPIPITQQSQPINGNVPVSSPIVSPQVSTTPVTSTMSTVSFINMISNKQLSIG